MLASSLLRLLVRVCDAAELEKMSGDVIYFNVEGVRAALLCVVARCTEYAYLCLRICAGRCVC